MQSGTSSDAVYVLGRSAREAERLQLRAQLYDPFMRQLVVEAGIAPGKKRSRALHDPSGVRGSKRRAA